MTHTQRPHRPSTNFRRKMSETSTFCSFLLKGVQCPAITQTLLVNGVVNQTGDRNGDKVIYKCNRGFKIQLSGSTTFATNFSRTCLSTAAWSPATFPTQCIGKWTAWNKVQCHSWMKIRGGIGLGWGGVGAWGKNVNGSLLQVV